MPAKVKKRLVACPVCDVEWKENCILCGGKRKATQKALNEWRKSLPKKIKFPISRGHLSKKTDKEINELIIKRMFIREVSQYRRKPLTVYKARFDGLESFKGPQSDFTKDLSLCATLIKEAGITIEYDHEYEFSNIESHWIVRYHDGKHCNFFHPYKPEWLFNVHDLKDLPRAICEAYLTWHRHRNWKKFVGKKR